MKYRTRIYYTETDKALMWDRWSRNSSHSIQKIQTPGLWG